MNTRATLLSLGLLTAMTIPAAANETVFPQTRAARQQLDSVHAELKSLATRLETAKDATVAARNRVEGASVMVKAIDKIDDTLDDSIRQLKSLSAIPQFRLLKTLVKNLESLQKRVHEVREKGDKAEKEVFKPLRAKLLKLEDDLKLTIVEVLVTAEKARLANEAIGLTRAEIQRRGNPKGPVAALESLSSSVRVAITPVAAGLKKIDAASAEAEKVVKGIAAALNAVAALRPAVDKLAKDLAPAGITARELDKVLSTKLELDIFGNKLGFTVRQILEGPGNIADFILKPFEALAEKALSPILNKIKVEVPLPSEFEKIPAELAALAGKIKGFDASFAKLDKSIDAGFLKGFAKALDAAKPPRPRN